MQRDSSSDDDDDALQWGFQDKVSCDRPLLWSWLWLRYTVKGQGAEEDMHRMHWVQWGKGRGGGRGKGKGEDMTLNKDVALTA